MNANTESPGKGAAFASSIEAKLRSIGCVRDLIAAFFLIRLSQVADPNVHRTTLKNILEPNVPLPISHHRHELEWFITQHRGRLN
jgi:hypothetical protein